MGGGQSKEEQLYQAVQNSNHTAVKTLRRDGTSLEWTDKDGRTPLILACTKGELFDMVITLLNLGASIKAFRPGSHGGFPLHHAAKRGLDKTVILLLSRGADPLALNDDGQTPLDMARNRGHVSVVRIIEDRICLFSGVLREISGPGFLEALAPQWVTRKIWAVVLPSAQARRVPKYELVIYQSPKVSLPRIVIGLSKVQMDEPNYSLADPVMILTDKASKTRFKFLSEFEGRRAQLEKFSKACKGIVEPRSNSNASSPRESASPTRNRGQPVQISGSTRGSIPAPIIVSSPPQRPIKHSKQAEIPEDVALAMAINASIRSANAEGLVVSPTTSAAAAAAATTTEEWSSSSFTPRSNAGIGNQQQKRRGPLSRKWSDSTTSSESNSGSSCWGSPEAGPSRPNQSSSPSRANQTSPSRADQTSPVRPRVTPAVVRNVPVLSSSSNAGSSPCSVPIEIYAPPYPPPPPQPLTPPSSPPLSPRRSSPASVATRAVLRKKPGSSSSGGARGQEEERSSVVVGEEKPSGQCVVCWDAPARGVCIPCGHMAGCMACLMEIKDKSWGCPVCRTSIQQVVKVFTV